MAAPKKQRVMEGSSGGRSYEDMLRSAKPAESAFEGVGGLTQRSAQRELKRLEDGSPEALERRRRYYDDQQAMQDRVAEAKSKEDPRYSGSSRSVNLKDGGTKKFNRGGKVELKNGGEVLRGCRGIQVSGKGFKGTF